MFCEARKMSRINYAEAEGPDFFKTLQDNIQSVDHKKCLNFISQLLQRCLQNEVSEQTCVEIQQIIQILLNSNIDYDLKKAIVKCIMKVPEKWHSLIFEKISHYLNELSFMESSDNHNQIRCYFENLIVLLSNYSISQNISVTNFSHIASTYERIFLNLTADLEHEPTKVKEIQITELCHFLIQTLIVFVDESCKFKCNVEFPLQLYECICNLMSNKKLSINTINNCGLLVVTINDNFFNVSSSLLLLEEFSKHSSIQCLALCHGFLASASLQHFTSCSSSYNNIPVLISDTLWLMHSRYTNDTLVVIGILKVMSLLTKKINLENHRVPKNCIQRLISLLLSHLDNFLNPAKNLSKVSLIQLIQQKNEFVISELLAFIENTRRIDRRSCVILTALTDIISFSRIFASYSTVIEDLRNAAKKIISSSYICQMYLSLMVSDYSDERVDHWFNVWIEPVLSECSNYSLLLEHILVPSVELSNFVFERIMRYCYVVDESNYSIIVKLLLEKKSRNWRSDENLSNFSQLNVNSNHWKNLLPLKMMHHVIRLPNSLDALNTANLIIENIVGKHIYTSEDIDLLKFFIDSQFAVNKSDFRCKFLNLLMQLFIKISQYFNSNESNVKAKHISDFVRWVVRYSLSNLFPTASYERRNSALRICKILIDTNLWLPSFVDDDDAEIFFNSLSDGFEENEQIAKYIIINFFSKKSDLMSYEDRIKLYNQSIEMMNGIRFSEHNTAAYILEILCSMIPSTEYFSHIMSECDVENMNGRFKDIKICEKDCYFFHLQILVSKLQTQLNLCKKDNIVTYPFHGFLHVIRYLLSHAPLENRSPADMMDWKILINDIIQISVLCNKFSVSIVSHSSPEGYLPDEAYDDANPNIFSAAQQTLLCNWRTVKDASLLLSDLVEKFSVDCGHNEEAYLCKDTFIQIGDHLKNMIYQIKHKGSFKQVYVALTQYCKRCWRLPDDDINAIPKTWLKEIENLIILDAEQLCLTRRSAGIPCIVLAILCTELDDKRKFTSNLLNDFMEKMFEILNNDDLKIESKIHSLNIIRDLFVHKDMAEQINIFVERAVIVAINGFKSSDWNLRNTSNLLMSAILTRIFGVSRSRTDISWKNKMTGRIFFQKYPILFDTFLFHLQQNIHEDVNVQSALYPILLILARLYPSYYDEWNDTFQLSIFIPYVYNCSENSIFKIRQLAVQAIVPFITRDIYVDHLHKIWSHIVLPSSENTKHGLLLQFNHLLQNIPELNEKQNNNLMLLSIRILLESNSIFLHNHSYVVKEKLLIILSSLLRRYYRDIDVSKMKQYPLNESAVNLHNYHLNERDFPAAVNVFNTGLQYLAFMRNNDSTGFVKLLEDMIKNKRKEQNSDIVVDFTVEIILQRELNNNSSVVQNFILNDTKCGLKDAVLKSKVIHLHFLNQLMNENPRKSIELLQVLSVFLKGSLIGNPSSVLSSFCKKYSNNSNFVVPLMNCLDILLEKQDCWTEHHFFIVKWLLSLYCKLNWNDQQKLRRFFFKHCIYESLCKDECLALEVWTFVIGKVSSIDEESYVVLKPVLSNSANFEHHVLVRECVRAFCDNFQSRPLFCCVGLISCIVKDLGSIFNNVEKNNAFFGDLPEYFEDHLLICEVSSEYLNVLFEQNPYIMSEYLSKDVLFWIMKQGGFDQNGTNINTLRDLINFIVCKFNGKVKSEFSKTSNFKFFKRETLEERLVKTKLSLLSVLFNRYESLNGSLHKDS